MNHELLDDYMADMLGMSPAPTPAAPSPVSLVVSTPPAAEQPPPASESAAEVVAPAPEPAPAIDMVAELMAEFDAEVGAASAPAPPAPAPAPDMVAELMAEFDAEVGGGSPPTPAPAPAGSLDLVAELMAEFDAEVGGAGTAEPVALAPAPVLPAPSPLPATAPSAVPAHLISAMERAQPEKRRRAEDVVKRWLRFTIGEQSYAVEVLKVQEVMRVPEVLPLRGADPSVLGVMNLRGLIVPVVDMGLRLFTPPVEITPLTRVIVLESDGEALGIMVSSVAEVMGISEAHVEHPGNLQCGSSCDSLTGVCRQNGHLTVLLDALRLLD